MTIPDETVERPAREPSDAELANFLNIVADVHEARGNENQARLYRLAAQRLSARGEISEAMVERAENEFWTKMKIKGVSSAEAMRAALEAALGGKEE